MVHDGDEAYKDTLWCWRFYLQKEFIACFLSLPLIVLVCESMTRRLAEGQALALLKLLNKHSELSFQINLFSL